MNSSHHRAWAVVTGLWIVAVVAGFFIYLALHPTVAGLVTAIVGLFVLLVAMLLAFRWLRYRKSSSGRQ
ncbi:MAG: hypothetical protein M8866_05015 [marine benthic group bacterium]|jgi:putative effector of murein hydrolase LrgA (UPF0299 family)|nr:hypothetical protein [Candidatus Benthicola marisminoris]